MLEKETFFTLPLPQICRLTPRLDACMLQLTINALCVDFEAALVGIRDAPVMATPRVGPYAGNRHTAQNVAALLMAKRRHVAVNHAKARDAHVFRASSKQQGSDGHTVLYPQTRSILGSIQRAIVPFIAAGLEHRAAFQHNASPTLSGAKVNNLLNHRCIRVNAIAMNGFPFADSSCWDMDEALHKFV